MSPISGSELRWRAPMPDMICGRVGRVLFEKDGFYILNMEVEEAHPPAKRIETVKGPVHGLLQLKRGVPLKLFGQWTTHPKYGKQFAIQGWGPWAESEVDVITFLTTSVCNALDPVFTASLVRHLGVDTLRVLTERPGEVQSNPPPGLDPDKLADVIFSWESALATRDLSELLKAGGIRAIDIREAIVRFGTEAAAIIKANPYRLMEIPSLPFPRVDRLAATLGILPSDPRRVEGAVLWALGRSSNEGHLFLRRDEVNQRVIDLFHKENLPSATSEGGICDFDEAVDRLAERKAVVVTEDGVYLPDLHMFERESARLLAEKIVPSAINVNLALFLGEYERLNKITLSDAQRAAVSTLVETRALVLTGLPGTGKTTAVRALVKIFEEARLTFALMAPTGIAAKRLAAVTGLPATTVHRALKYDGTSWGHGAHNRFLVDAVIVDEMSMVDQELCYRLLSALTKETMVVLVGDDAQLPSVGPGNVLRELVECQTIPAVRLTQIFRQSEKGEIVSNSHRINRGEMVTLGDPKEDTEFKFARVADESRIQHMIVEIAAKLKDRDANFQVLAPKYDGTVGVTALNARLRDRLNPEGPPEWKRGDLHFRLGDRLMVIRNDYQLGVYNGDVGKLVQIGRDSLVVKIHGVGDGGLDMTVEFSSDDAVDKLRLAYAITVHKSQGSEFDTIILPIVKTQGRMLQRNLLYTAVTRARKRVLLLGEEVAIQQAIANNKVIWRNTAFSKALAEAKAGFDVARQEASAGVSHPHDAGAHSRDLQSAGEPVH